MLYNKIKKQFNKERPQSAITNLSLLKERNKKIEKNIIEHNKSIRKYYYMSQLKYKKSQTENISLV